MRHSSPWQRKSTGVWHVWFNGKQRNLGHDEDKAREKFRRMTQSGATGDFTVREVVQRYWKWAKANRAPTTYERRQSILESFAKAMRPSLKADARPAINNRTGLWQGQSPTA
jgi:hypothetical protein